MVILNTCHSHVHVLNELNAYAALVTKGSYCIFPDTFIEFFPPGFYAKDRPWDVGNNPYTTMRDFLNMNNDFEIDKMISAKASISETIDGYLKK